MAAVTPVPSQAGHRFSFGFATRDFIRTFHVAAPSTALNLTGALPDVQRANALTACADEHVAQRDCRSPKWAR